MLRWEKLPEGTAEHIADGGEGRGLISWILQAGLLLDEVGSGLVFLAAAQETLTLHQDDAIAADLLGQIRFGQEGSACGGVLR